MKEIGVILVSLALCVGFFGLIGFVIYVAVKVEKAEKEINKPTVDNYIAVAKAISEMENGLNGTS